MMYGEDHGDHGMRYFGKYRAYVRDTLDPQQRFRLRAYCPAVMGQQDDEDHWLDWADGCFPTSGTGDEGSVYMPQEDAGVWIEFEMGEVEHPIWTGCWFAGADPKTSQAPTLALGVGDESTQAPKGATTAQTKMVDPDTEDLIDGPAYPEAPSSFSASYPDNRVIKTPAGHVIEIDDTEGQERVHVWHTAGTYLEVVADGTLTIKSVAKRSDITRGTHVVHDDSRILVVDGALSETINGLSSQVYLGPVTRWLAQEVAEYYQHSLLQNITSDLTQSIGGTRSVTTSANDMLNVTGSYSCMVSGPMDLTTLEKVAWQVGNTSQSSDAWLVNALAGNISHTAVLGNVVIKALAQGVQLSGLLGVTVDGGTLGVTVGTGAAEPMVKGTSLSTALTNLSTALQTFITGLAAWIPISPAGPTPLASAPTAAADILALSTSLSAFNTSVSSALSALNKVA